MVSLKPLSGIICESFYFETKYLLFGRTYFFDYSTFLFGHFIILLSSLLVVSSGFYNSIVLLPLTFCEVFSLPFDILSLSSFFVRSNPYLSILEYLVAATIGVFLSIKSFELEVLQSIRSYIISYFGIYYIMLLDSFEDLLMGERRLILFLASLSTTMLKDSNSYFPFMYS